MTIRAKLYAGPELARIEAMAGTAEQLAGERQRRPSVAGE
jgi:hypothetical protein